MEIGLLGSIRFRDCSTPQCPPPRRIAHKFRCPDIKICTDVLSAPRSDQLFEKRVLERLAKEQGIELTPVAKRLIGLDPQPVR